MGRFLLRRCLWAIVLVFAVTVITYAVFFLMPSDPARLAAGRGASPRSVEFVRKLLHFDEPVWKQYGRFVWNLFRHGSLGYSYVNREQVRRVVDESLPVRAGEHVVITADTSSDGRVVSAVAKAAYAVGAHPVVVRYETQPEASMGPPAPVARMAVELAPAE